MLDIPLEPVARRVGVTIRSGCLPTTVQSAFCSDCGLGSGQLQGKYERRAIETGALKASTAPLRKDETSDRDG
ncbi:hypothetical protein ACQR1W_38475 [Bradyrhizobium sp. HKCCYLS1011]|uniref:hypothetical protein n=1 Tax=Bradyrhizobium sp. HKCCYLS1011 TaxID=3420733 RepID=UPI003EBE0244